MSQVHHTQVLFYLCYFLHYIPVSVRIHFQKKGGILVLEIGLGSQKWANEHLIRFQVRDAPICFMEYQMNYAASGNLIYFLNRIAKSIRIAVCNNLMNEICAHIGFRLHTSLTLLYYFLRKIWENLSATHENS